MKRLKWIIGITFFIGISLTIFILILTNLGIDLSGKVTEQELFLGISLVVQMMLLVCIWLTIYWQKKNNNDNLLMLWVIALSFGALGWNLYFTSMWIE